VTDERFNGSRFRPLTVLDNYSRECLAIHIDKVIRGEHVVGVIDSLQQLSHRKPDRIQGDNGSEFISKPMDKWAYDNDVVLDF